MTGYKLSDVNEAIAERTKMNVFVNGAPASFVINNGVITLNDPPKFEPVERPSGAIWRVLGKLLRNEKIYNRGCRCIVTVFYETNNIPRLVSFRLGAKPLHRKCLDDDGDGHFDEGSFEYD